MASRAKYLFWNWFRHTFCLLRTGGLRVRAQPVGSCVHRVRDPSLDSVENAGELAASADAEFAVDVWEVPLDGP